MSDLLPKAELPSAEVIEALYRNGQLPKLMWVIGGKPVNAITDTRQIIFDPRARRCQVAKETAPDTSLYPIIGVSNSRPLKQASDDQGCWQYTKLLCGDNNLAIEQIFSGVFVRNVAVPSGFAVALPFTIGSETLVADQRYSPDGKSKYLGLDNLFTFLQQYRVADTNLNRSLFSQFRQSKEYTYDVGTVKYFAPSFALALLKSSWVSKKPLDQEFEEQFEILTTLFAAKINPASLPTMRVNLKELVFEGLQYLVRPEFYDQFTSKIDGLIKDEINKQIAGFWMKYFQAELLHRAMSQATPYIEISDIVDLGIIDRVDVSFVPDLLNMLYDLLNGDVLEQLAQVHNRSITREEVERLLRNVKNVVNESLSLNGKLAMDADFLTLITNQAQKINKLVGSFGNQAIVGLTQSEDISSSEVRSSNGFLPTGHLPNFLNDQIDYMQDQPSIDRFFRRRRRQ